MNETMVTVQGYVGNPPDEKMVGEVVVASFRLGSTPRRFSRDQNAWVDQETNWYTVNAWRNLGRHVLTSVRVGEPVIVHGRLRTNVWKDEEDKLHTTLVIDAVSVGHDLTRGTTVFLKDGPGAAPSADEADLAAHNAELAGAGGRMTSDGRLIDEETAA